MGIRNPNSLGGHVTSFDRYPREVREQAIMAVAMLLRQVDALRAGDADSAGSYARDMAGCMAHVPDDVQLADLNVSHALYEHAYTEGLM